MPNPVVHFEVMGKDAAKTQKFYADLFDWKVDASNPMNYGVVEAQDGSGIGGGVGATPDGQTYVTVYVQVDDIDATLEKAGGLGATVVMPKMDVPGGPTIGLFTDPDGNLVGLVHAM